MPGRAARDRSRQGTLGANIGTGPATLIKLAYMEKYQKDALDGQAFVTDFLTEKTDEEREQILRDLGLEYLGLKIKQAEKALQSARASRLARAAANASRRRLSSLGGRRRKGTRKMRRTRSKMMMI
jgi:hypothetical protein